MTRHTVQYNLATTFKGKNVLFIENDYGLTPGLQHLRFLFSQYKIRYIELYGVGNTNADAVASLIKIGDIDGIAFQTTWTYESSHNFRKAILEIQKPLLILESYVAEPTLYYAIEDSPHTFFIYKHSNEERRHKFYKLSQNPYWNYENGFDK